MARKKPASQTPSRLRTTLTVIGAGVVVASLAFISLELSLLAAGFFAVVAYISSDVRRRRFWENAISFRMKKFSEEHKSLSAKVTTTRQDMLNMRQQMADINRRVSDQDERLDTMQLQPGVRPAATKTALVDEPLPPQFKGRRPANAPQMPNATRAGQKPAFEPAPVRGAPDEDYNELSDMVVRELVTHAVRAKNIDIFVQPIVRLPQRRVRFYEMYARVRARPGMYLPARRYMKLAQETDMTNEIDNILLMECLKTIQASAHVERAAPLFLNITSATLKNGIFMKRLLAFLASNRHLAPRLVFELPYADFKKLEAGPREILKGLGRLGCSVSLDNIDVIEFNLEELAAHHVRFVKVSAKTMLPYTRSDKGRVNLQKHKRKLEISGVSIIVEKVESENDLLELLDFDIAYGQGHLFGRPDLEAAYRKRRAA